jgi:hypothetical protein
MSQTRDLAAGNAGVYPNEETESYPGLEIIAKLATVLVVGALIAF